MDLSLCSLQAGLFKELKSCCYTPVCAVPPAAPTAAGSGEGFASLWELWALGVMPGAKPMKYSTTRPKLTWSTCCVIQHQQRAGCNWVQPHTLPHAGCSHPIRSLPSAVIHRLQQKPSYAMGPLKAKCQLVHVVLQCRDKFLCCYFC